MTTCHYCKNENENTICVACDGKHTARAIFKKLKIERSIIDDKNLKRKYPIWFDEEKIKKYLIERDVLGLGGLNQDERRIFFSAFDSEFSKLQ